MGIRYFSPYFLTKKTNKKQKPKKHIENRKKHLPIPLTDMLRLESVYFVKVSSYVIHIYNEQL